MTKEYRAAHKEEIAAYKLRWKLENPEKYKALQARTRKQRDARYYENNFGKIKCRRTFQNEVRRGRIRRQPCVQCGTPNAHAHHEDYSKPLEVIWLCRKCHNLVHAA